LSREPRVSESEEKTAPSEALFRSAAVGPDVTDDLESAVEAFLRDVDTAHGEYEQGYVDADATLSVVMSHVEELRETYEDT
jgi:hypothetical protein